MNEMVNAGTLDLGAPIMDWSLLKSYRNDTLLSTDDVLANIPIISSLLEAETNTVLFALMVFMLVTGVIAIALVAVLLVLVKKKMKIVHIRPEFLEESNLSNISQIKGTEEITNQMYESPKKEELGKRSIKWVEAYDYSKDMPTTKQTDTELITRPKRIISGPILSRTDVVRTKKPQVGEEMTLENKRRVDALRVLIKVQFNLE